MSAQAISGVPAGELPVIQRLQQLQALIESAGKVAAGIPVGTPESTSASAPGVQGYSAPSSAADFASTLQAATGADAAGITDASFGPTSATAPAGGEGEAGQYEALVDQAAARNGLDPAVLHGLIQQESGFDPSAASSAGAAGLTQLMPATASSLGVANPLDPAESIEGGARYLSEMMSRFGGNTADALAAYNAGPGAVQQYGGVPPYAETESYVEKVLGNAEAYRQSHPEITGALV